MTISLMIIKTIFVWGGGFQDQVGFWQVVVQTMWEYLVDIQDIKIVVNNIRLCNICGI